MYAMLGDGNKAVSHLENLWKGFIQPNTMYHEDGNPVIETPPSAATAILDMLIQSHRGYIHFFPAVPDDWYDICFDNLLCWDGFEVGACLKGGELQWIKIKSNLGKTCRFKADFKTEPRFSDASYKKLHNGIYEVDIDAGQTAIISTIQLPAVEAARTNKNTLNCYGLNERNRKITEK